MRLQIHTMKTIGIFLVGLITICKISAAPVNENAANPLRPTLSINQHLDLKPNTNENHPESIDLRLNDPYIDFSFKKIYPLYEGTTPIYPVCATVGIFSHADKDISILLNGCLGNNCNWTMRSIFLKNDLLPISQFDSNSPIHFPVMVRCQYFKNYTEPVLKFFEWKLHVKIQTERLYKLALYSLSLNVFF
ncbi:hypothetical protein HMI54_008110 [Coelomomyces lativittatus]|nr:hypothetical protein HMI56_002758 [Coelomomyces lativittatus]KAJ1503405.1 hypothetical protein HMI54_008110 [Coelomomyces lativittatus]